MSTGEGVGVPFSATKTSCRAGMICGARLRNKRSSEAGRACVAIMIETFKQLQIFKSAAPGQDGDGTPPRLELPFAPE
jgi:hypothetical protein